MQHYANGAGGQETLINPRN